MQEADTQRSMLRALLLAADPAEVRVHPQLPARPLWMVWMFVGLGAVLASTLYPTI